VKVDAVEFSLPDAVTSNAKVSVRFQGAHPVRAGSRVPDGATLTPWVDDLTLLSGFALVRFRVVFDLGQDVETWPFGVDSYRPRVDWVRLRSRY